MRENQKGFTLIELLVVLVIIAILAATITWMIIGSLAKSNDSQRIQEIEAIAQALHYYYLDNGQYPPQSEYSGWDSANTNYRGYIGVGNPIDQALAPYMGHVPADPRHDGTEFYYYYDGNHGCSSISESYAMVIAYSFETDEYKDRFSNLTDVCNGSWYCEGGCFPDYVKIFTPYSP